MARSLARMLLIGFCVCVALVMFVIASGSTHTREMKMAWRAHFDSPSEATRAEVERVKAKIRRRTLIAEGVCILILGGTISAIRKLGKPTVDSKSALADENA